MAATQTTRVKYTVDGSGEVGVNHENWSRADYVAGLIYVTSATADELTDADLYDGCVVVQKDTGISYRYNGTPGNWVKKYINFPLLITTAGDIDKIAFGVNTGHAWTGVQPSKCVNYSPAWRPAGTYNIQVKGIYLLRAHFRWSAVTSGSRMVGIQVNGSNVTKFNKLDDALAVSGLPQTQTVEAQTVWNVGDEIKPYMNLFSSDNADKDLPMYLTSELSMIRPVW